MIGSAIHLDEKTRNKIEFQEFDSAPLPPQEEVRRGVSINDLIHASANGFTMIVRYVLAAGVDPNESDDMGRTAMSVASTSEIRDLLLKAGAQRAA